MKNAEKPNSVAWAQGTISRTLSRVTYSARLDQPASSMHHSSSDPCWVAQIAAAR